MKLEKVNNQSMVVDYKKTENVLEDVCSIIDSAKSYAYQSVNIALVQRNWLIGYRIAEEELKGKDRADYGLEVIYIDFYVFIKVFHRLLSHCGDNRECH